MLFLLFVSCAGSRPGPEASDRAIARGVAWLLSKQGPDGGWRSETYGSLKGGAATTALVLYAASHLPARFRAPHEGAFRRGWVFLRKGLDAQGRAACLDGTVDYPTYATAMTLTAIRRFGWKDVPAADLERMKGYLLDSQLTERQGWTPEDPVYGGWDHIGRTPGAHRLSTGADISVTRYAVEAFAEHGPTNLLKHGWTKEDSLLSSAFLFSQKCTHADFGYFFSPDRESPSNKAGWGSEDRSRPRAYGTATIDGMLIELHTERDLSLLARHMDWLIERGETERVPGFLQGEDGWPKGLRYYYWAGLGSVLELSPLLFGIRGDRERDLQALRADLRKAVLREQRPDGSWASESAKMREDDPLIATSFALIALGTGAK